MQPSDVTTITALGYVFAAFGLAFILGHARITEGLRDWMYWSPGAARDPAAALPARVVVTRFLERLITCPGCAGFWTGLGTGLALGLGLKWAAALALATAGTNTFLALMCGLVSRE